MSFHPQSAAILNLTHHNPEKAGGGERGPSKMPVESASASLARHFFLLQVSGYSMFLFCLHVPRAGQLFLAPIGVTFTPLYATAGNSRYLHQPATPAAGLYLVNGRSILAFVVVIYAEMFAR